MIINIIKSIFIFIFMYFGMKFTGFGFIEVMGIFLIIISYDILTLYKDDN